MMRERERAVDIPVYEVPPLFVKGKLNTRADLFARAQARLEPSSK